MKTLSRFFEYQRSIVAISLFLIGIATYLVIFHQKPAASNSSILAVERGTITEEVNVTGNTKPVFSAALAFERGGKILRVNVAVGNEVREGDLVASLDASDLAANFAEAEANIKIQEAKLAELRAGTRPEELALAETQTEKAKRALQNADENLRDKIVDAYTKSDDAIRNEADQFFSNPRSANPTLHISVPDASLKIALEANRIVIEQKLIASKISLQTLYARATDLTSANADEKGNLMLLQSFLNDVSLAVNGLTSGTIDGYRAHLSSARSDIALAISNLSAAEEKWRNAESDSTIADEQLNLKRAGPTPESIQTQEASVLEAKAHTESIRRELSKAIMRAPFAGRVTRVDAVVGEIASPNTPLIAVISDQNLEIEVHIPEVDIGRVALHDAVDIGFDAFPGEHFKGMVMAIDPAETIVNGVVNFKVKVGLGTADPRLKSGLTANLAIETATKLNALIIPQFAVIENDQGTFVRRVINGITEEIPVKLGIRSNNGFVEVISGVAEADTVLNVGLRAKSQ